MVVLRVLAQILIAAALMLLAADALASLENSAVTLRSLSSFSELLHLGNPEAGLREWQEGFFRDGLIFLVMLPAWVVLGFVGVLLAWAAGSRS